MKYVGLVLLLAAFALAGRIFSSRIKERVRILEKFRLMLKLMQTEIQYVNMPTYELVKNACERKEISDLFFLRDCLMKLDSGMPFDLSWEQAVCRARPPELESGDIQLILSFGSSLGTTDRDGQLKLCGMYEEMTMQKIAQASERVKTHAALYSKLGIICGLSVVIILI